MPQEQRELAPDAPAVDRGGVHGCRPGEQHGGRSEHRRRREESGHDPPARERGREPERQERQRGDEETGAGRVAAVRVVVAELEDEERDRDGAAEERLGPRASAPEQHQPGCGEEQHGRDDEQAPVADEDEPGRMPRRRVDAEEPARLLHGELLRDVPVREVKGRAEREPVIEPEQRDTGNQPGGVATERSNPGERGVQPHEHCDQGRLVLDDERETGDDPRPPGPTPPREQEGAEAESRCRHLVEVVDGE